MYLKQKLFLIQREIDLSFLVSKLSILNALQKQALE